jgi:dTDP-4-dehydrorhamnose reductase
LGPAYLADACAKRDVQFVSFSSDLVFDGSKNAPYLESDLLNPLNNYGRSKAEAERSILENNPGALIIRTSAFFGPWDQYNFVTQLVEALAAEREFDAITDLRISPTYVPDLVNHTLDLLIDGESGIWHLANRGDVSWAEFAYMIADKAKLDESFIRPVSLESANLPAARPTYSVLGSAKGRLMPSLTDALSRYFREKDACNVGVSV